MKNINPKHLIVEQTNSCLPISIANQLPLSLAIRKVMRNTTRTRMMPLVALSLTGLATPVLAQDAVVELSSLDGSNGFVLNGVAEVNFSGFSVSAAGDVNGDGVDDLLIGADRAGPNGYSSGVSYVVFGATGVGRNGIIELSALDGSNGFVLNGVTTGDHSGFSVSAAGDINNDGVDDLLIGARLSDINGGGNSGASYVVFGASAVGASGVLELSDLDGSNGFVLNGAFGGDWSGSSVSTAGDVNGDGVDDILIGASGSEYYSNYSGISYVVFGSSGLGRGGTVELSALDGRNGFELNGVNENEFFEYSVSAAGDVNGDGVDDLLIGAKYDSPNGDYSGASYVVFGNSDVGGSGALNISTLDGSNGFVINGVSENSTSGRSVSGAGDVNGDGIDDLLIGASNGRLSGSYSGASHVVFGASEVGSGGTLELSALDGSNGFAINGVPYSRSGGFFVSAAGDINGDGVDDMLIGAPNPFPDGFDVSHVVFGASEMGNSGSVELSALNGSNGFVLNGVVEGDEMGGSVSAAGDVNADGIDDLLIGARSASPNGIASGASYVVFGQVIADPVDDLGQATLEIPVSASSDDAEENTTTGKINRNSSDLELVDQETHSQLVGMRFNGLTIPQGATITKAFVQFQTDETYSGTTSLMIHGQATDNAPTFTTVNANISSRAQTNAAVDWTPAPWTNIGEAGAAQQTPDIASIVQEIVKRQGWSSGNSLALIISGSGQHIAESFDGDAAPVLHVEYSLRAGNNQMPVVDAGSDQTATFADGANEVTLNLHSTVSDDGLPEPSAVTITWNKVFGPGTVTFGDASAEDTSANFDSTGTYVLRLTVDDGALSNFDDITVKVNPHGSTIARSFSRLDGSNGFVLKRLAGSDNLFSYSVSTAGDINGDGVDDLLFGAQHADPNGASSGASYVVFGGSGVGSNRTFEFSSLDGNSGFVINGVSRKDFSGFSVSAAGDINGDGIDDLLIGASGADPNGNYSGASYVVFGGSGVGSNGTLELSSLDGNNGFVINGVSESDRSGNPVSAAGDVNGDGIDDILIGAIGAGRDPDSKRISGASYVVFGASEVGSNGTLELSALNGNNGFVINGVSRDISLRRVSAAGDVNGDGVDDLLIGTFIRIDTFNSDARNYSNTGYVVFGANEVGAGGSIELSALDGSNGFVINEAFDNHHDNTNSRMLLSSAGDVNGDNIDDLLIGTNFTDITGYANPGFSYVVFGDNELGSSGSLDLSVLNGINGFEFNSDFNGRSRITAAGDVNDDSVDDILIDDILIGANSSYVVFGQVGDYPIDDPVQATLDIPVSASSDDAEENIDTGNVKSGSSDLELGHQNQKNQLVGMRFNDLNIPQGAIITNASIQFQVDETHSGATTLMIEGQTTDNAPMFTSANGNISSRDRTNAAVNWEPAPWTTVGDAGPDQQTPEITSIIQEIVDRPRWSSGNSLAIIITGVGRRAAESFDGDAAGAPVLHVEYTLINQAPTVDAGPNQTISLPLKEVILDGTVNDDGLPSPEELVTSWTKVSGPGTVTFGDANAVDTTANFDSAGTYVLRLTANDGDHSVLNELTITVNAAGTPVPTQPALVELSSLAGDNGFVLNGKSEQDYSGFSVSSAGDVNGDGIDDFVIGSKVDETYVVFGASRVGSSGMVELSALNGRNGFVLNGVAAGEFSRNSINSGNSVSAAGDVNGDGIDDLLIGASGRGSFGSTLGVNGASYVVFGASGIGASGTVELTALNGDNGVVLNGIAAGDYANHSGYSVSSAGDINDDGIDDLLIGALGADLNGDDSGSTYVVFGSSELGSSATLELSSLDGNNGFVLNGVAEGDRSGFSVSSAGDVNNDGIDDLLIGANGANSNGNRSGASYVVFGANGIGASGTVELSALNGNNGFMLNGASTGDNSGRSVSAAGDINNDGVDDLLIGASRAGNSSGASYLVFGANGVGASGTIELSTLDGSNGFVLKGVFAGDFSGASVSAAGDVNGDGVDDLLIGAPSAFCNFEEDFAECFSQGASYVVFGASGVGAGGTVELSMLNGSNGFILKGVGDGDYSGSSVSAAGDVNNDGIDDLLIGAPGASRNGFDSGVSHIVFGKVFDDSVPAQITLDIPVSASSDDAEESIDTGQVKPDSSDLEFGNQGNKNQLVGMRFNGLDIPQGATITNAYIQFQADETHSGDTTLMIEGQATDNASMFTRANGNISSRDRTNSVIDWEPAPWVMIGEAGADQQTPNIASVIQEIVNRPGWLIGNSLAVIITGNGRRTAESFNSDPAIAPFLHVEYITGTGTN